MPGVPVMGVSPSGTTSTGGTPCGGSTCFCAYSAAGFLDNVCTDIIHYEDKQLVLYPGNLSEFVKVGRRLLPSKGPFSFTGIVRLTLFMTYHQSWGYINSCDCL